MQSANMPEKPHQMSARESKLRMLFVVRRMSGNASWQSRLVNSTAGG
jgi:hypothetical protein